MKSKNLEKATAILQGRTGSTRLPGKVFLPLVARIAVRNHGYNGIEVAKAPSLSPPSVGRLVENGENVFDNQKHVAAKIDTMQI